VDAARTSFVRRLADIRQPIRSGAVLSAVLPDFLGGEGTRRYFFGAQNPSELRGTGGLIGAWAVLTVTDGRLDFGGFTTIGTLTAPDARDVEGPDPDFESRYRRFAAPGHGSNINMTPDFPSAARAILNLHERERGERLDGAMVADPYVFEALLRLTGPVDVPDVRRIDADSVVDFVTNEQWAEFPEGAARKPVLGSVAEVALTRFLVDGGADPATSLQALARTAGDGHLLLYSSEADEQDALEDAGVAGVFPSGPDSGLFSVVANNAGANKLDYYLEQEWDYEVWLDEAGGAYGRAVVRMTNTAPTSGRDRTVLGPNVDFLRAGENLLYVSTYCAPDCALLGYEIDGAAGTVAAEREFGMAVFPTTVQLASGEAKEMAFEWHQPSAQREGAFRLAVPSQPLMRPVAFTLTVHAPPGHTVVADLPGAVTEEGTIRWAGELPRRWEVQVETSDQSGPGMLFRERVAAASP
jgi:hypothetical protein